MCMDATSEDGRLGRLVNDQHIKPNSVMKKRTIKGKPYLCLYALRDIKVGKEIEYDYRAIHAPWRTEMCEEEPEDRNVNRREVNEELEEEITSHQ